MSVSGIPLTNNVGYIFGLYGLPDFLSYAWKNLLDKPKTFQKPEP